MTAHTKRKHVAKEDEVLELPTAGQYVVSVKKCLGSNLILVRSADDEHLVSMPAKFRRNVWARRGTYLLVEPIPEGKRVKGQIVTFLTKEHINYYKENSVWPKAFDNDADKESEAISTNPNRPAVQHSDTDGNENQISDDSESASGSSSKSDDVQ